MPCATIAIADGTTSASARSVIHPLLYSVLSPFTIFITMSTELFTVKEHALPGSHVREYASITKDGKDHILELAVKQYTPKRQPSPLPANAVTILACHASGFPKVFS